MAVNLGHADGVRVEPLHGDEVGAHGDARGLAALLQEQVPELVRDLQRAHAALHGKAQQLAANVGVDEALLPAAQVLVLICTNRNTLMPPDLLSIYCSYSLQALQAMQGVRHQDLTVSNGSMKVLAVAQS